MFALAVDDVVGQSRPVRDEVEGSCADFEGSFADFFANSAPVIHRALVARYGVAYAEDSTADAMATAWSRWDRVSQMANPAGYVYRIAARAAARRRRRDALLSPLQSGDGSPSRGQADSSDPDLVAAIAHLSLRQPGRAHDQVLGVRAQRNSRASRYFGEHPPKPSRKGAAISALCPQGRRHMRPTPDPLDQRLRAYGADLDAASFPPALPRAMQARGTNRGNATRRVAMYGAPVAVIVVILFVSVSGSRDPETETKRITTMTEPTTIAAVEIFPCTAMTPYPSPSVARLLVCWMRRSPQPPGSRPHEFFLRGRGLQRPVHDPGPDGGCR